VIIAGELPDNITTLTFKAIQHYSNGKEVAWIDAPAPGSTVEPQHPAPNLHLTGASASGDTAAASSPSTRAHRFRNGAVSQTGCRRKRKRARRAVTQRARVRLFWPRPATGLPRRLGSSGTRTDGAGPDGSFPSGVLDRFIDASEGGHQLV
jgi:Domain of unkown function (DUF1775)